jgi:hypothetical protein
LRLSLLAPEIVDAILDGRQPEDMTLAVLMRPFAVQQIGGAVRVASDHGTQWTFKFPTTAEDAYPLAVAS